MPASIRVIKGLRALRACAYAFACCCSAAAAAIFLIYKIEAAEEAAPTIFGRYLVAQRRQLLAASVAFRAEHWVQYQR